MTSLNYKLLRIEVCDLIEPKCQLWFVWTIKQNFKLLKDFPSPSQLHSANRFTSFFILHLYQNCQYDFKKTSLLFV